MDLFLFCLSVSFACVAIHISVTHQGMIFNLFEPLLKLSFPEWIRKPLYECLPCMGSFWTTFIWCSYIKPIEFELLFAILITVGMNKIWCAVLEKFTEYGC